MTFTETPSTAPVCLPWGDAVERAAARRVGSFGVDDLARLG